MGAKGRRPRGSGGVTEVRRNELYRVRADLGPDPLTGRRRQVERTVHGTRQQAQAALTKLLADAEAATVDPARILVAAALAEWLAFLERSGYRPMTLATYRQVIARHISPALGAVPLAAVTAHRLDTYYGSRVAAGLAAGTVRLHHSVLSSAFGQMVTWGWLATNPARDATPPRAAGPGRKAPTPAEVRALIDAARPNVDLWVAVILAVVTGARRGELCGLRWSDVDWEAGVLTIERSRVPLGAGDSEGPTKSGGARVVSLGAATLAVLARYREEQEARAAEAGVPVVAGGWLLSRDGGRTPWGVRRLTEGVRALGERCGIVVSPHMLRHFAATAMIGAGVDVKTAASRLGHTVEVMLATYVHAVPELDRGAAAALEASVIDVGAVGARTR